MPKKLPRRVGDILKFDRNVRLKGIAVTQGATQNSRFILIEKLASPGRPFKWRLQDVNTGVIYKNLFRPRYLVRDEFLTKAYRASAKSGIIPQPLEKQEPELKENQQ